MRSKKQSVMMLLAAVGVVAPALAAPGDARAANVELYVQAPYDFATQTFDLDQIETMNLDPIFGTSVNIPYDKIEKDGRALLADLTKNPITGHEHCDFVLCPDADWEVRFDVDFNFPTRGQPVLTPWGMATDNGTHVQLDSQVAIRMTAHVHISPQILADVDFDVPVYALIGVHGGVSLGFYPTIKAEGAEAHLTLDDANVDITGLDGLAIEAGAVIGTAIGAITGGGVLVSGVIGAITGKVAIDAAKAQARDIIAAKMKSGIEKVNEMIKAHMDGVLNPKITQANNVLGSILAQPIPGIGMSFGQLQTTLGMSIDVRSTTIDNTLRTAATARFANAPSNRRVSGRMRFPKTVCDYVEVDDKLLGHFAIALDVLPLNADLAGGNCSIVDPNGLRHSAWYGENPDRALKTGLPANNLVTWATLGSVSMSGAPGGTDTYDCPFSVDNLPDGAIVEVRGEPGSDLYARLGDGRRKAGGRFLVANVGGVGLMVDHLGVAVDPSALDLGVKGPATKDDCPTIWYSSGTGLSQGEIDRLKDASDPEKCPQCGLVKKPGEDFMWVMTNVDAFMTMAHAPVVVVGSDPGTVVGAHGGDVYVDHGHGILQPPGGGIVLPPIVRGGMVGGH